MMIERGKILEKKTLYNLEELTPSRELIRKLYPDLLKCQGCNTCTMSCPQDLNVMEYISFALYGKISEVAEKSFDCVMCTLCADRCPSGLAPYHIALLCRRLNGRYLVPHSEHLAKRVSEIKEGIFDSELLDLKKMSKSELLRRYKESDIER